MNSKPQTPESLPEDEERDPPYPQQDQGIPLEDENDPPHPPFSPDNEPDIPQDPESTRVVQPEPPND